MNPSIGAMTTRLGRLLFSQSRAEHSRDKRLAGILQGAMSSLGNKALSVLISFVSVPLTLHYLGTERFGAWLVIGSTMSWLTLTDFGLGHGLNNAVTTAVANERPGAIRMHLSNYILSMSVLSAAVFVLLLLSTRITNFAAFFGVRGQLAVREVNTAGFLAVLFFLMRMPLSSTTKVYNAHQEGRIANYWGLAGNIASFIALIAIVHTEGGLPLLVCATSGVTILIDVANNIFLYARHKPELAPGYKAVNLSEVHQIQRVGTQFFILTLMAMVTFQSDNLVVGHFLGSAAIPQYSITYSLFNYATLPQTLLFPYLWTAYNEAIARRDIVWVERAFRISIIFGVFGTTSVCLIIFLVCRGFIGWWAGVQVRPSHELAAVIGVWVIINAMTNPIACLFAAASHLRNQIVYSLFATVANIGLSIWLVQKAGLVGVILSTVIAYSVFVCVPVWIDARILFRRLRRNALGHPGLNATP